MNLFFADENPAQKVGHLFSLRILGVWSPFFTCPVGIFDLYVPCSALCVFMDGQAIIPFSDLYIYDILILLSHLKSSDRWREVCFGGYSYIFDGGYCGKFNCCLYLRSYPLATA